MTADPVPSDELAAATAEVVEVFTGESLEEAMAAAVSALGPDLQVRRARKVRSGVRGLMGKDRYEVLAVPAGGGRPSPEAVTAALEGLLERAESEEAASTSAPVRPIPSAPHRAAPVAPPVAPPVAAPRRDPDLAELAPHPRPDVADHPDAGPLRRTPLEAMPTGESPTAQGPVPQSLAEPGWSRERLRALGVPAAVLAALPKQEPSDDLAWLVALTEAVSATVAPPATADAEHPVVLDGHGTAGALALLEAGTRGTPPGRLSLEGRTVAASALELALAVRAAVLS